VRSKLPAQPSTALREGDIKAHFVQAQGRSKQAGPHEWFPKSHCARKICKENLQGKADDDCSFCAMDWPQQCISVFFGVHTMSEEGNAAGNMA
jgi:hypothetical protein